MAKAGVQKWAGSTQEATWHLSTSWCSCLRLYTHPVQPSTATGQPHCHVFSRTWERKAQSSSQLSWCCPRPTPGFWM